MVSHIFIGSIIYIILIGGVKLGASLDGTLGSIIFWVFFVLSSFIAFRVYSAVYEFFTFIFSRCNQVDVDSIMEKYEKEKSENI